MRQSAEVRRVHRGDPGAHRPGRLAVFGISIVFAVLLPGLLGPAGAVPPREVLGSGDPFGSVESITVSGGRVTASGWAVDPDTASSIIVQMYVDGSANTMAWAGLERPDVAAVYPWAGAAHGFSLSLDAAPGTHSVCVYAINTGPGASVLLRCGSVVVPSGDPFGSVESITVSGGRVTASGWAVDPDTASSIIVQMYVDGSANTMAWAGVERPDVAAVYPWAGAAHGFSLSLDVAPGTHSVCVYAINTGPGASVLLRCGSVVVPSGDPFGSVESISVSGGRVTASGWAVDPDTASSIIVQMYVDGSANTMAWAGLERPDVAAVYPWAGAAHGFSLSLDVAPGAHRVCVYAINTGPGASVALDCRLVAGPPFFVYGSLRNGQSGYYLIAGKTTNEFTTRMPLLDLYVLSGSSYPYAVPNDGNQVGIVGEVMSIHPVLYQDVVSLLDRYERYDPTAPPDNQVYVRELRPTREELPSWVYVAGPRQASYLRSSGILIASGDWLRW